MRLKYFLNAIFVAALLALPTLAVAQTILTVSTPEQTATYTLEELLALPQTTVVTKNDYVDTAATFQGPRLRAVLEPLNVGPDAILKMVALNDFSSNVPALDAFDYDVILAVLRDGEPMSVRDKGPIWVIYPMDDHAELRDNSFNGRLVWQLKTIAIE